MNKKKQFFLSILIMVLLIFYQIFLIRAFAADKKSKISIDLYDANLTQVLPLIAQFLHINILMSPSIQGQVTLHLRGVNPSYVMNAILVAHGLAAWNMGRVWWIASQAEILKRKQTEYQWQEATNNLTTVSLNIWQIKYAKANDIVELIRVNHNGLLSKQATIQADSRTNIIYIQDHPMNIKKVNALIHHLDVPTPQILLEARLASVDKDFERNLGLSFKTLLNSESNQKSNYLTISRSIPHTLLDMKLIALEKAGHAQLISSPRLFTANRQSAYIESGEEVPYQEVSEGGGTAVVFKKAVLGLKVTPQVLPHHLIALQLEINQDRPSNKTIQGMPTISTRQINSHILVRDGETVILGGIYETTLENSEEGLPILMKIPLIGFFFKQKNVRQNKRELLIFVTPKVIEHGR